MIKKAKILDIEEGKYHKVLFKGEKYPKVVFDSVATLENLKKWKAAETELNYVIEKKPSKKAEPDGTYKEYWNITQVSESAISGTTAPQTTSQTTTSVAPVFTSKLTQAEQDITFIALVQEKLEYSDEDMEMEIQTKAQEIEALTGVPTTDIKAIEAIARITKLDIDALKRKASGVFELNHRMSSLSVDQLLVELDVALDNNIQNTAQGWYIGQLNNMIVMKEQLMVLKDIKDNNKKESAGFKKQLKDIKDLLGKD